MSNLTIQQFFIHNGLPWSESTKKSLEEAGAHSVEMLKLMEQSEWEALFANEKQLTRQLALKVFDDLRKEHVQPTKCATTIPLNNPSVEPSSANTAKKRKTNHTESHSASYKIEYTFLLLVKIHQSQT